MCIRDRPQTMITTNGERMENLKNAGVDYLVEFPFDMATAGTEPEEFVRDILVGKMRAKAIVSGTDFHFGHNRRGDVELLKELAPRYGSVSYTHLDVYKRQAVKGKGLERSLKMAIPKEVYETLEKEMERIEGR